MRSVPTLCVAILVTATSAVARTWEVAPDGTGDATTIQAGLDLAGAGDTVNVACGTYYEHDVAMQPGVLLRSDSGKPDCVTIDAQQHGRVISLFGTDEVDTVMEGLTIRGGMTDNGGGLNVDVYSLTLSDCILEDNFAYDRGGGIYIGSGTSIVFDNCEIRGNVSPWRGGGVCAVSSHLEILGGLIVGNYADEEGAGIYASACAIEIDNVLLKDNRTTLLAMGAGGVLAGCTGRIVGCRFEHNWHTGPGIGGALYLAAVSNLLIERTLFVANLAQAGGAVWMSGSSPEFHECTFASNGGASSGALFAANGSHPSLSNTIVAFNGGQAAILCVETSDVSLACSNVFGNAGGDVVGCLVGQARENGNFSADPLFCDPEGGDFSIRSDSPCAPPGAAGCGLVGALPVGCAPVSVEPSSWAKMKAYYR